MVSSSNPDPRVRHFGFLLLENYSMIAFANAVEVLRMANLTSRQTLYTWSVCAAEGGAAQASNGLGVCGACQPEDLDRCDAVFVCGGVEVQKAISDNLIRDLRRRAARGQTLGALCTGTHALAAAGVLDGYRCAVHWENLVALRESCPKVNFALEVFVIDRERITASGGIAPLHLMLHLVRHHHGNKLAMAISEQFIVDRVRDQSDQQKLPQPEFVGPGYEHLAEAAELMAANIEEPLPLSEIADAAGISLRQLERLFHRYYKVTPAQHYLTLRLRRARELLSHTSAPIMQITVACGFQTASHFCKAYRALFGHSPSEHRRQGGSQGMVHVVGAPAPAAVQRRVRIERGAPMYVS
ncbi:MAG: GlxA family transcriptional regulator [Sphaerotilus natans subsp. sulfidivorans]|uniref:GlxA family transcriptional regulator n=1 Tax=Sphaerotilus sulfidivorans TaxID=639200 RepID=UPI00235800DB|nr:GlxA family transcriptional regulator [Sphaerotilus sulfidivorans]MCK6403446.1 GlxA family transcriptional regulator [Sphaerotilus sulfidivorans]